VDARPGLAVEADEAGVVVAARADRDGGEDLIGPAPVEAVDAREAMLWVDRVGRRLGEGLGGHALRVEADKRAMCSS
jgi:hypothetical protein